MGSSKSTAGGGGKSRKTPVQTYESFKKPEDRTAAVERQKAILASTRTTTGAFANQEAELTKAGYKLSEDKSSVLTKDGKTVAGVTSTGSLFSGSKKVTDIIKSSQPKTVDQTKPMSDMERTTTRIATSLETMGRLEQLDEPSKAREAEIQKALNYGRGVQPAPTVLDPTRIVASTPTLSEVGGDIGRAIVGGTAPSVPYLKAGYQPEKVKGILDIDTITNTLKNLPTPGKLLLQGIGMITGGRDEKKQSQPVYEGTTEFVDQYKESLARARENKRAAILSASQATKGRSLFQIGSNLTFGGK
jgi:hypothetical protein